MPRVVITVVVLALTIFALVDAWQRPAADVRGGSRSLWTLLILCVPVVGPTLWLAFGRAPQERGPDVVPPDDDPDFLRGLGR